MCRWRRKESNKNVVAEEEKQQKCGDAKKGRRKREKLFWVEERASLPLRSLNMHDLLAKNQCWTTKTHIITLRFRHN